MAGITVVAILTIGALSGIAVLNGISEAMLGISITAIAGLGGYHIRCKKQNDNQPPKPK